MTFNHLPSQADCLNLGNCIHGSVRLFDVDDAGNPVAVLYSGRNLVTYQGADMLAKVLAGQVGFSVSGMYVEFQNASYSTITPARSDTVASLFNASSYYTGDAGADILRIDLASSPAFAGTPPYTSNRVTFWGVTTLSGIGTLKAVAFSSGSNSKVRGAALIAKATQQSSDLVMSRVSIDPAVTLQSDRRIGIEWILELQ